MLDVMRKNEIDCLNKVRDGFFRAFGTTKEFDNSNPVVMETILTTAQHNEKHNEFPDFFFDGGIIEHFEVTASKENRKGSKFRIEDAKSGKETKQLFDGLKQKHLESDFRPGALSTFSKTDTFDDFSYEAFVDSFKKNAKKHIEALRKSNHTGRVVFLVEQLDARLSIFENNVFNRFYYLHEDRNLLSYIRESLKGVNYIIFYSSGSYEIIDLGRVGRLIEKSKDNLDIRGGRYCSVSLLLTLDLGN